MRLYKQIPTTWLLQLLLQGRIQTFQRGGDTANAPTDERVFAHAQTIAQRARRGPVVRETARAVYRSSLTFTCAYFNGRPVANASYVLPDLGWKGGGGGMGPHPWICTCTGSSRKRERVVMSIEKYVI